MIFRAVVEKADALAMLCCDEAEGTCCKDVVVDEVTEEDEEIQRSIKFWRFSSFVMNPKEPVSRR